MYEYTRVTFRAAHDGVLMVQIALMRADGTHKYPRTIRRPWEHVYTLPSDMTAEGLYWELRKLCTRLQEGRAEPTAPPEGATGGPDVPLPGT